jgi:hypothetical protein
MNVPIPDLMKDRPLYHDLPIPYSTFVGPDGAPDFKVVDEKLRRKCMVEGLCALCGKPLTKNLIVFIGGPKCVESRTFFDPAVHKECALYAVKVCPYLSDADWDYAKQQPRHLGKGQTVISVHEEISPHRPDRLAVYYCRSYDMVRMGRTWYAKAGRTFRVDWNTCARMDRT